MQFGYYDDFFNQTIVHTRRRSFLGRVDDDDDGGNQHGQPDQPEQNEQGPPAPIVT